VDSFSYWSIKLWFHTEGKLTAVLIIPSSWGFPTGPVRHQVWLVADFWQGALPALVNLTGFAENKGLDVVDGIISVKEFVCSEMK
jgi:hypothetical protein